MTHEEIRAQLSAVDDGDTAFSAARAVAYFYQAPDSPLEQAIDLVVRLIDRQAEFEALLSGMSAMINAIAREAGLFPYMSEDGRWHDLAVLELMKAPGLDGIIFHIEQALAFQKLATGRVSYCRPRLASEKAS